MWQKDNEKFCKPVISCNTMTKNFSKAKKWLQEDLPALPPREFFAEAARAHISAFWKNSQVQINSKLNSKPYDNLH